MKNKSKFIMNRIVALSFSFAVFLLTDTIVCATELSSKTNELICENVKVKITTKCTGESNPIVPDCIEQYLLFIDQTTNKTVRRDTSGKLMSVRDARGKSIGRYLDALATGWVCKKGISKPYLIVWYNTGGNCDECEWQEIFDLNGTVLASTLRKTKQSLKKYDGILLKLGLSSISVNDFLDIQLR